MYLLPQSMCGERDRTWSVLHPRPPLWMSWLTLHPKGAHEGFRDPVDLVFIGGYGGA